MDSELIQQAGLGTSGDNVGGERGSGMAEELEPVAGPSRLVEKVVESRRPIAKRSRASVRRDSKLDGGASDEEAAESSMPKPKKAKATVSDGFFAT